MFDLKKPRTYKEICLDDDALFYRTGLHRYNEFKLPVNVYLFSEVHETDIPVVEVKLDDLLYYISIEENPKILTPIPKKYTDIINKVIKFVSLNYKLLFDFWNNTIDSRRFDHAVYGEDEEYKFFDGEKFI